MLLLFQVTTGSEWSEVLGGWQGRVLLLVYGPLMWLVYLNLITATVTRSTMETSESNMNVNGAEKLGKKRVALDDLQALFNELDEDGSGDLTREEFGEVLENPKFIQKINGHGFEMGEVPDLFEILDEGTGKVKAAEFCEGLLDMQGSLKAKDLHNCLMHLKLFDQVSSYCSGTLVRDRMLTPINEMTNVSLSEMNTDIDQAINSMSSVISKVQECILISVASCTRKVMPPIPSEELMTVEERKKKATARKTQARMSVVMQRDLTAVEPVLLASTIDEPLQVPIVLPTVDEPTVETKAQRIQRHMRHRAK
jgi:hypothetical protein